MDTDEILARLADMDDDITDYEEALTAYNWLRMLNYAQEEGFIEIDGEHVFLAGEAHYGD